MKRKGLYFYRGEIVMRGYGGWFVSSPYYDSVYQTRDDALNAIDDRLGGQATRVTPKRRGAAVRVIGKIPLE